MLAPVELEIRAFREADFELDAAVNRRGVEHEQPRFCASFQCDLHAADLHVVRRRKPHFLEDLARPDGERHRLGELLPHRLQRVEVGVAPFLLFARGEGRSHAAASA